jgi:single-stranded-DNA-specific exonuclease
MNHTNTHYNTQQWHRAIQQIFQNRNLSTSDIQDLVSWNLRELPNLEEMQDMELGAIRLIEALEKNENIAIYGDYDVDGTSSCARLYHFFCLLGKVVYIFQPGRFEEGYGLHLSSIDEAISKNIQVMVTVDCGITNNEAADYAKSRGLDLIITDHHSDMREEMPKAYAVINPNRRDEPTDSPLRKLAGVGVAFALCLAMKKEWEGRGNPVFSIYSLLPFVAMGTICDLVPLTPMNLKLTRHGLKQMKDQKFAGLNIFFTPDDFKKDILPYERLSFHAGPLINSKGRLDHPQQALELLITQDRDKARKHYSILEDSNFNRKRIQKEVVEEAKKQVLRELKQETLDIIIIYASHWHEGVVGIVASKMVELFKVPAIVLTDAEDKRLIKGSARSAGDLNIFELLNAPECQPLYAKFGGHKAAAGLSIPRENFREWRSLMEQNIKKIPYSLRTQQDYFDVDISFAEVNPELLSQLEKLHPFGQGNPAPIFRMTDAFIDSFQILKGTHVKFDFIGKKPIYASLDKQSEIHLKGISFFYLDKIDNINPTKLHESQQELGLQIYFQLKSEIFRGKEFLQLHILRITQ